MENRGSATTDSRMVSAKVLPQGRIRPKGAKLSRAAVASAATLISAVSVVLLLATWRPVHEGGWICNWSLRRGLELTVRNRGMEIMHSHIRPGQVPDAAFAARVRDRFPELRHASITTSAPEEGFVDYVINHSLLGVRWGQKDCLNDEGIKVTVQIAYVPFSVVILLCGILPALVLTVSPLRSWSRRRHNRCVRCAYDLRGSVSTYCPECGDPITATEGQGWNV